MNSKKFKEFTLNNDKNVIAVDFDGVIHKSSKGFHDGTIYDEPVDDVKKGLEYLSKSYKLVVYTCKANPNRPLIDEKTGTELIWEWMEKYDLSKYVSDVVYGKPNAKYYIDDKAICFIDWNQILKVVK